MNTCYICQEKLTEYNSSEEHIILNAIGGKLKSKALLCKKCNSEIGDTIDNELAEQLNFYANFLNISRNRGKPQPVIGINNETGEKWIFKPGGKPVLYKPEISKEFDDSNDILNLTIKARSKKELKQILTGLKRTYNIINPDELSEQSENKSEYLDHHTHFSLTFGGINAFRSICKSSVNFYIFKTNDRTSITHLIPFIKSQDDKNIVWTYYPEKDIIKDRNDNEILHSIIIQGKKNEKLLFAYIEYFDAIKYIVLLNDNYNNNDCVYSYFFDVLNDKEVNKTYELGIDKSLIQSIFNEKKMDYKNFESEQRDLIKKITEKQVDEEVSQITSGVIEKVFGKYPEGCKITNEMIAEFSHEIAEEFVKFSHRHKKRKM